MTIQGCIIRAVALLLIIAFICSVTGAVKIQTERQYPGSAHMPNSSPVSVGTAAFHNSTTFTGPYKTNSWLSPILWADSMTQIYPEINAIKNGDKHPLYQLPVYPLPWSLYYCKTPYIEQQRFEPLNVVNPYDTSIPIPQGLFIRPMPVYKLYDTQQFNEKGGHTTNNRSYDMYDLTGQYSSPAIHIDPGFNASHIAITRMGDYDAELRLSASDDPGIASGMSAQGQITMALARGSPFINCVATAIPRLNITTWHGKEFSHQNGTVTVNNKEIAYDIITTRLKNMGTAGPETSYRQTTSWTNHTWVIFYPKGSAEYSQWDLDPVMDNDGPKSWLVDRTGSSLSFTSTNGPNFVVIASVPSPEFTDKTTLETLASAAFLYPSGTTVAYGYSDQTREVTVTYSLQTMDPLKIGGIPLQGLLPIHYGAFFGKPPVLTSPSSPVWVENGHSTPMVMESVLGDIRFLKSSTYTCSYSYPGILPYIPGLPTQDETGIADLKKWLKNVENRYGSSANQQYKYIDMDVNKGYNTYSAGKLIWSASNLYQTANGVDNAVAADAADSARRSIELFFRDTPSIIQKDASPGQAPYYSYYDPKAATILLYPAAPNDDWPPNEERYIQMDGFGTATKLADHHYTYGYYINAAAELSFTNASWMTQYRDVINQLVFDVAFDPEMESKARFAYPKKRLWDPYTGHCESNGMTYDSKAGNNDESISEELHFWAGVIRWGAASGQPDIERLGIMHYTHAVYSYYTFWRDYFGNYKKLWDKIEGPGFDPLWVSKQYAPQMWDSKVKQSTFFGTHPAGSTAITLLPMTGASFYHGMDTSYITSYIANYTAYIRKWNMDPLNPAGTVWQDDKSPWGSNLAYYGELACWYAVAEPEKARSMFFPLDPATANVENPTYHTIPMVQFYLDGCSVAEVDHFIRFLEDYGTPDPLYAHATNTPFFMTFVRNGTRTYVGYNPGDSKMDITFSDSTVIRHVPARQFGFYPSGLPGPLQATINATPMGGTPPLNVSFTDRSRGAIIGWEWNFGDGGNSTEQNPVHLYSGTGTYNVTLTVTDTTQATSSDHVTITVSPSGELPGRFSRINLTASTSHAYEGFPSLAIGGNTAYVSYLNATTALPWQDGKTQGNIQSKKMSISQGQVQVLADETAGVLGTYHAYPAGVAQPDWGRSSIALDRRNDTPMITYLSHGTIHPQWIHLSYKASDAWTDREIDNNFGWSPSLAINSEGTPGIGFSSGTRKQPVYVVKSPKDGDWKTQPWDVHAIGDIGNTTTFTPTDFFPTLLYTGSEQIARVIFYHAPDGEIRHAFTPDKNNLNTWTIEPVKTGVSAGWVSAAYDSSRDTIGVCWYDTIGKTLRYQEKPSGGVWGPAEQVDTSLNDTGSNCTLAFGPANGVLPGPGISYYDATAGHLCFAWKDSGTWHTTVVDSDGAGRSSSLAYTTEGYPCIAYRHEGMNMLRLAYLNRQGEQEASFDSDVTSGKVPLTVQFFDRTVNDTIALVRTMSGDDPEIEVDCHYWWDLDGDGTWDAQDIWNPVYTYRETGTYDVKLLLHVVVYNIYDTRTDVVDFWGVADYDDYITVTGQAPGSADFTATPVSGLPPLEVQFTDTSAGSPTSWNWTFGDGTGSHEQNPVHTYQGIGRYTVSLETNGPAGTGAVRRPGLIDANAGPSRGHAGILRMDTEPSGADVYIDGILQGETPINDLVVKAGTRSLHVHRDGYHDWNGKVIMPAGELKILPLIRLRQA